MKNYKLVRDKIPEIIRKKGLKPITHAASKKEYETRLREKLVEESKEFQKSGENEELADILEVINAIIKTKKTTIKKIEKIRKQKRKERGSFGKKIILKINR